MSAWIIASGVVVAVAVGALILWRRRTIPLNIFSVLLVVGIAGLAVAVTVIQVRNYQNAADGASAPSSAAHTEAPPAEWQAGSPGQSPMVGPATGAAAPPAVQNPHGR